MNKFVLKIVWIVSIIIMIIANIHINLQNYEIYDNTNYILMGAIGSVNLVFGLYIFFRKNEKYKLLTSLYLIFLIAIFFIPVYHNGNTYAPIGPNSNLMGLAFKERYQNIYGITISKTR